MRDAEATLLRIPGVTEAQVFAKVLVRCEFPMTDETIVGLQETQAQIEHETGWKVEMTISAGKRPEPMLSRSQSFVEFVPTEEEVRNRLEDASHKYRVYDGVATRC